MRNLKEELKNLLEGEVSDSEENLQFYSNDASLFEVRPRIVVFPQNSSDIKRLVKFVSENRQSFSYSREYENDSSRESRTDYGEDRDGRKGRKRGIDQSYNSNNRSDLDQRPLSITARSGGTGMDGGALNESIIIDLSKHLNNFLSVQRIQRTAERAQRANVEKKDNLIKGNAKTEPGVYYKDFEKETLKLDFIMPSYPASRDIATVGGMVANNAGGELTLQYGKTEDYINSLKAVLSDGNEYEFKPLTVKELEMKMAQNDFEGGIYKSIYELIDENYETLRKAKPKVSKNSAGYFLWNVLNKEKGLFDLTKLIVGSQGTLCVVTEIDFKLVEKPAYSQMMILFLDDLSNLGELTKSVLEYKPTTFESYDDKTLKLAARFIFDFLKRLGLKNIFTIIKNGIPEALSILSKGFPRLVLQITLDGANEESLKQKALELEKVLREFRPRYLEIIKDPKEAEEYWLVRRESFNLLRHKVRGGRTAPFIDDIIIDPEHLPEFLPKLNAIIEPYKKHMVYNIAGHIGNGNFHIIPLMDISDEKARKIIPELAEKVYDLVIEYEGSITAEHNDGIIRTPFLKKQYGAEVYSLFEKVKNIFDPRNIFNPGKKIGGTLDYAVSKIKKHN